MLLHQRFIPGLAIASHLVGDERSGEAAVIDPTRDVEEYLTFARDNDLHIRHILETHVHADFVSGARELKARLKAQPVIHSSGMGGAEWTPPYADHVVKDGDEVQVGSMRLKAIHTPGHTPEHVSWALYDDTRSWVLPYDRPIQLIVDNPAQVPEVVTHLIRVGFDEIQGYVQGGIDGWETSGYPLATLGTMSVHQLRKVAMPLDETDLTDQEALDIAAFVNKHDRPAFDLKNHLPKESRLGEYNAEQTR